MMRTLSRDVLSAGRLLGTVAILALLSSPVWAKPPDPSTIQVSAEAKVTVPPNQARVELGVVTQAPTSEEAAARNARSVKAVLGALRDTLPRAATIETTSYAVQPDYQYGEGREPKIIGYTATNLVRVTLDDLAGVGSVIDTATKAGANRVERIQLTLKDEHAARARALQQAAVRARADAAALADTLGVEIVRIVSAVETTPEGPPVPMMMTTRREADTPIIAGSIEIRATVTLTVEVQSERDRRSS